MSRLAGVLLIVVIGGCGREPEPRTGPPERMVGARGAALSAERDWRQFNSEHSLEPGKEAAPAAAALRHAELLEENGSFEAATAVYEEVRRRYRLALEQARQRVRRAEEEAARQRRESYRAAVDARARAQALREKLDFLRESIDRRVSNDEQRDLVERMRAYGQSEVFGSQELLRADQAILAGRSQFQAERHSDAAKRFEEAAGLLEILVDRMDQAEPHARALGLRDIADDERRRLESLLRREGLDAGGPRQAGLLKLQVGDELVRARDYEAASHAFTDARTGFEQAARAALALVVARERAKVVAKEVLDLRRRWVEFVTREGVEEPAAIRDAEAAYQRGLELLTKNEFDAALKALREARKGYDGAPERALERRTARLRGLQAEKPPELKLHRDVAPAVSLALAWLAAHQDADGRWDCDDFMAHDPRDDVCDGPGARSHDVGVTGLALLAFLEAGFTDRPGDGPTAYYALNLDRGLRYLRSVQDEEGCFGEREDRRYIYDTAIAAHAMAAAYARTEDARHKRCAQAGMDFLVRARNRYLGWRYRPRGGENDTSVTFLCVRALSAGWDAGLEVPPSAFEGAQKWALKVADPEFGQAGYNMPGGHSSREPGLEDRFPPEKTQACTAMALFIRLVANPKPKESGATLNKRMVERLLEHPPVWNPDDGSIDLYYWHAATLALSRLPKKSGRWSHYRRDWHESLDSAVLRSQHPKGSGARTGSWDPIGAWGAEGGRVYSTALMALCLQYRGR